MYKCLNMYIYRNVRKWSTMNDLMKQIIIISKNIKTLTELMKTIDEQINQPKSNNEDDKEKMDTMFEKKQIGSPSGSFQENTSNIWVC